jgi:hypothetical protein
MSELTVQYRPYCGDPGLETLVWVVVTYRALGVIANALTPSPWERIIWLPITLLLLGCSLVVAMT